MRIVDRNKVPAPECCDSLTKKIRSLILPIKRTDLFGLSHPNVPIRTRGQWTNHDDYKQIKFALLQLFEGRCAYCEMEVSTSGSAIECFRPRSGLTATKTGKFYPLHHAWLEFAWENLYLSCIDCSKNKGARFPIAGEPCELLAQGHELDVEDPLLLDPCDTRIEISDHLEFTYSGMVIPRSNRGEVTIKLLKLNSHYLINKRKEDWYWKSLQNGYQVSEPIRDYLPPSYNKKARTVYEKMTSSIDSFKTKVFEPKIEKIELFNIGPLKGKKTIQINAQGQDSWLMILGDNGAGKSTILKAITLVLLGRDQVAELIHKFDLNLADLVNYLSKSGTIKLKFSDEFPDRTLTVHKNGNLEFSDTKHFPIIFNAYGSSRLAPTKNNPSNERQSSLFVDNLFNHFSP
ncbi:AAA family ATPase, partial [Vibrio splendidus]